MERKTPSGARPHAFLAGAATAVGMRTCCAQARLARELGLITSWQQLALLSTSCVPGPALWLFTVPPLRACHFTEEETEAQREAAACQGPTVRERQSRGLSGRWPAPPGECEEGLVSGVGHTDLMATRPRPRFLCSGQSWGGPPPGVSGAPAAQTEPPCSLMPQLQAPAGPSTCCRGASPRAGRGTPCDGSVRGCCPGRAPQQGPGCWGLGEAGEGRQESQVSRAQGTCSLWGGVGGARGHPRALDPQSPRGPKSSPWGVALAAEASGLLASTVPCLGSQRRLPGRVVFGRRRPSNPHRRPRCDPAAQVVPLESRGPTGQAG
nr:uncharacterized protein LOC106837590 [Equus asinus]